MKESGILHLKAIGESAFRVTVGMLADFPRGKYRGQ